MNKHETLYELQAALTMLEIERDYWKRQLDALVNLGNQWMIYDLSKAPMPYEIYTTAVIEARTATKAFKTIVAAIERFSIDLSAMPQNAPYGDLLCAQILESVTGEIVREKKQLIKARMNAQPYSATPGMWGRN